MLDHVYGTFMMPDHQLQKELVESCGVRGRQLRHLLWGRHTRHCPMRLRMLTQVRAFVLWFLAIGHGLYRYQLCHFVAIAQPALHEINFIALRCPDPAGDIAERGSIRPRLHQQRHIQGLLVMQNHVPHEHHIIRRITGIGNLHRLSCSE